MMRMFFYGTLKRGYYNHNRMRLNVPEVATFVGRASLPDHGIVLYGMLPYAVKAKGVALEGEVWDVHDVGITNAIERMEIGAGYAGTDVLVNALDTESTYTARFYIMADRSTGRLVLNLYTNNSPTGLLMNTLTGAVPDRYDPQLQPIPRRKVVKASPVVPETYAVCNPMLHGFDTGLTAVYSFHGSKLREPRVGLSEIKSTSNVLIGITNPDHQGYAEKSLVKEGWTRLLDFSGNGGTALKLWIKDREGDTSAQVGPEIPTLTCKIEDECVVALHSDSYSFSGCCGAYVYKVLEGTRKPPKASAARYSAGSAWTPGCYSDITVPLNYLQLAVAEVNNSTLVSNLMDMGFVPIYRYSKEDGTVMFLMAKQPPHSKGALLIQGKKETSFTTFIKQIHGIA